MCWYCLFLRNKKRTDEDSSSVVIVVCNKVNCHIWSTSRINSRASAVLKQFKNVKNHLFVQEIAPKNIIVMQCEQFKAKKLCACKKYLWVFH